MPSPTPGGAADGSAWITGGAWWSTTGGTRRARAGGSDVLSGLGITPCECIDAPGRKPGEPCSRGNILDAVVQFAHDAAEQGGGVGKSASPAATPAATPASAVLPQAETKEAAAVRAAAAATHCSSESCVLTSKEFQRYVQDHHLLPRDAISKELALQFKTEGPRNSTALLSNTHIDTTMQRWARVLPEFYPCPFAMMDFDVNGDQFGRMSLVEMLRTPMDADLGAPLGRVKRLHKCFGCVVNTDTSKGPGKHWVAVFVDCRAPPGGPWTVEYFDSVGNPPCTAMTRWMEKTRAELAEYRSEQCNCPVLSVPVTSMDHQRSQTECGLYALFYIRRRLEGTPIDFFSTQYITDDIMTEFRRYVFRES